jgi:cytochrome c553
VHFLLLQLGLELLSVQDRISARGLKPLAVDAEYIEQQISEQRTRTEWILTVQEQLQTELEEEEVHHLNRFYDTVRMRARTSSDINQTKSDGQTGTQ